MLCCGSSPPMKTASVLTAAGWLCLSTIHSPAATFVVTNNSDGGPGSLRQAILDANASAGADVVAFDMSSVASPVTLASQLHIADELAVVGPGADQLTVSGGDATRVIFVDSASVAIDGLTIAAGRADYGAGVFNSRGTLTIGNCTFRGNHAAVAGGAIYSGGYAGSAAVTVTGCQLLENSAAIGGGGVWNDGAYGSARLDINGSTLAGNSADLLGGGGVYNHGDSGVAVATIINSTLSANHATSYSGGAACNYGVAGSALLEIHHSTICHNTGIQDGAALLNLGQMVLGHNLLANAAAAGGNVAPGSYPVTSAGYNLADDTSPFLTGPGDLGGLAGLAGFLGPLADNGGPTPTHALLEQPGNPALNGGDPALTVADLPWDQRGPGFIRVVGAAIDIGAFESQSESPAERVNDLLVEVGGLPIHHGIRNALAAKLRAALGALAIADTAGACASLQDFVNLTRAQSGKKLSKAEAARLAGEAISIRRQLGCTEAAATPKQRPAAPSRATAPPRLK